MNVSGYRCPKHNAEVSNTGLDGPHTISAFDVRIAGYDVLKLTKIAMDAGFSGIGINQKGDWNKRIVHLDRLPNIEGKRPRPWVWTY